MFRFLRLITIISIFLFVAFFPQSSFALTRQLPFSGQLLTPGKLAVPDGDYTMRFSIYTADRAVSDPYPSDADSGSRVWSETQTVKVERGLWKVVLGSATALPDTLNFETGNYYLGIRINTDPEMVPRKKILPVPLALNAESVGGVKPGTGNNDILQLDSAGAINIAGNITTAGILQGANLIIGTAIQLPANSILTADIMDGTISTIDLADGLITTIKLADASVSGSKIVDSSISTAKLADASVTISKIADGAITTIKLSDGSVSTAKLADLAVTTAKIADASITVAKLATGDLHFQNTDTGTTSLVFGLGAGTAIGTNNFSLTASNAANKPAVRYNGTSGKWQISNDGTTFADIASATSATLQGAYDAGNTITTTDGRNILFTLADTATDSNFLINIQGTGNSFQIQDAGTPIFTVADGGLATFGGNINLSGNRITNASRIDGNASGSFLYTAVDVRSAGSYSSLALDSSNYPHIAYYTSDSSAATIADWDGTQWTVTDFDTAGTRGYNIDLVIDGAGVKHAVYEEQITADSNLIYAKYVGSGGTGCASTAWSCTTVDSAGDVGRGVNSIDVDGSNVPHISYYDTTDGDLKHAWYVGSGGTGCASTAWSCEIAASADNIGSASAIAINRANGDIHGIYYNATNGDLMYRKYSGGSWSTPVILDGSAGCIAAGCGTRDTGNYSYGSNLVLNASGNPRVAYLDDTGDDLYYGYSNDGGTAWTTTKIDGGSGVTGTGCAASGNYGQYSSLTLDSGGNPHISYYNYSTYDLRYASNNGSVWTCQTLDSANTVGLYSSIKMTSADKVYISYQDTTNVDLKIVTNNYPKLNIYSDVAIMGETGNLGIGVLQPTERLDVAGNIKATGNISSALQVAATGGFYTTSSSNYMPTIYGGSAVSGNFTLYSTSSSSGKGNIYINPGGKMTVIGNSAASASLATAGLQITPNYLFLQYRYYNPGTGYTFSGNTGEANSYGGTPFTLVSAVGDMAYFGSYQPFGALEIDLAALGAGGAVIWEYWNGAWVSLAATDGTTNFTADGVVSFTPPADWAVNSVNGYSAYWIRANVTTTGYTTAPTANSTIIGRFGTAAAPLVASLIQPAGIADSTTWSATGTMLGINTPSSFNGNFIDLQVAGSSKFVVTSAGNVGIGTASPATALQINGDVKLDTAIASGSLLLGNDQDDFSSSILETGWTFTEISPPDASDYSLTANAGHLQITVPSGSGHDCWTGVTDCARMLRSVNNTDAVYSTKIDGVNITTDAQAYGIMLWQDSSNYLRFEFWTNGSVIQPTAFKVIGGAGSSAFGGSPNISLGASNYLRATKSGDNFYLDYSTNGSVWERSGSFTQAGFTVNQAGVHVINANTNSLTTGNFDYFHINQGGNLQVGGLANIAGILNVQNAAAFSGNLTLSKADPSIIFNTLSRTDTDFWLGVQEDGAGTDNDLFQIGDGTTVGTNPFFTIDTSGNVGIGTASPTQKLSIAYGNLSFTQVSSPGAPTVAVGAAGVLTGNYYYKITLVTANGETSLGTASSLVAPSSQRVDLSSIPTGAADQGVTARRIYRTSAGGTDYYLLTTINDNTTTIYTDNTADGSLGTNIANNLVNTTAGFFYLNGSKAGYLGGNRTVALGVSALDNLTYGGANSAIGNFALLNTTTGSMNTAFGYSAVMTNVTGQGNTVIGYKAGEGTSGGSYSDNTILGGEAGQSLSTGSNNVLVGRSVGGLTTGSNNIILGYNINAPTTSTSNYLSIGNILYGSLNTGRIGINVNSSFAGNLDIRQYADGDQIIYARRNTDTSPTGNFIQFRNAAGTGTIFGVDISGNLGVGATPDTGARLYATNSGSGIINVARLTNDIPAANNSGVQILFGANRTTSGMSNIAGVAGLITDITDAAYKGALIFSTADNAVPVERARIDNVGNVSFGVNVTSGTTTVDLGGTGTGNAVCHTTQTGTDNEGLVDCTSGPIADYAEMYPVASGIEYGDVVVVGAKMLKTKNGDNIAQLVKSSAPYQSTTIGIVSNNYGDFTSAGYNIRKEDNPMPVALNGRVPVKLSLENGPIAAGDPLTSSSTPGVAMKATGSGYIIGKALESFTPSPQPSPIGRGSEGEGKILVFVNPGWYNPLTGPLVQGGDNQFDEINIGNLATTKDLVVTGLARIKGDLIVEGKVRGDLEVEGIVKIKGIVGGWRSYENHFLNSKFENEFTVSEIASSSREDGTPRNDSEGGVSWEYHKIKLATDSLAGSKVALDHSFNFKPADDEIGATWRFMMKTEHLNDLPNPLLTKEGRGVVRFGIYADEQNYTLIQNGTEPQSLKFISCAVGECTTTDNIPVDPASDNHNYVIMIKTGPPSGEASEVKLLIDGQEYAKHATNVPADSILHFYEEITTNIDASQSAVLDYLGVMVGRYEPF